MNDIQTPVLSTRALLGATALASLLAVSVLISIILPAEYNIDPTGIGRILGLTQLSGELEKTDTAPQARKQRLTIAEGLRSDLVKIEVPAGSGLEYKLQLEQYAELEYHWTAEGGILYFDFHGEPEGDATGYFKSYTISSGDEMRGSLTTPFAGSHGWYWRNDSPFSITVTLNTRGVYEIIGLKN